MRFAWAVLVLTGALLPAAWAAEEPTAAEGVPGVLIRGRIQNGEGEPLSGVQVTLIRTHKRVDLRRLQWQETEGVLDRATTDPQGFYEIRAADDGSFASYFLRFHDPQTFDAVRYVPPPDEDITRRFRRGRPLVENRVAREQRDWPKVQEEIARAGPESVRGQLLRRLGLPERIERPEPARPEREEWWYYRRGIVYQFDGNEAAGERRFDPVPAPPPVAAAGP